MIAHVRAMIAVLAASGVALAAAPAQAAPYEIGSPIWNAAVAAGTSHWGAMPCGGEVSYGWTSLPAGVVGYASWVHPSLAPGDPSRFTSCRVDLDPTADLAPDAFCTTLAHELGHLHGHEHVDDPANLMSARMGEPLPGCVAAMAPYQPPATVPLKAAPSAPAPSSTGRRATQAKHRRKPVRRTPRAHRATKARHR